MKYLYVAALVGVFYGSYRWVKPLFGKPLVGGWDYFTFYGSATTAALAIAGIFSILILS